MCASGRRTNSTAMRNTPYSSANRPDTARTGGCFAEYSHSTANSTTPVRAVSGLFALLYGVFRIAVEFVRLPDAHIGYLAFGWVTMGQVLSLPLVAVGAWLLVSAYRRRAA